MPWGGRGWRNWYYVTGVPGWGWPAWGMGAPYVPYGMPTVPYGYPYAPPMTPQDELEDLKGQAEYFEDVLDGIKKRIEELEEQQKEK